MPFTISSMGNSTQGGGQPLKLGSKAGQVETLTVLLCQGGWKCENIAAYGLERYEAIAVHGLLQFILSATATVY